GRVRLAGARHRDRVPRVVETVRLRLVPDGRVRRGFCGPPARLAHETRHDAVELGPRVESLAYVGEEVLHGGRGLVVEELDGEAAHRGVDGHHRVPGRC